jgi:hypothetical protein
LRRFTWGIGNQCHLAIRAHGEARPVLDTAYGAVHGQRSLLQAAPPAVKRSNRGWNLLSHTRLPQPFFTDKLCWFLPSAYLAAHGMKHTRAIISAVFALLLGSLVVFAEYPRFKRIEKRGPEPESVSATLPGDMDTATAAIAATFNDWADFDVPDRRGSFPNKFPYRTKWSFFFLFHRDEPRHPLFPSDEQILLDRCSFLIHIAPAEDSHASVEIFEYQPTIWVGEYLGFSAHAILLAMLHDIRPAQATTTDRKEVLQMIEQAVVSLPAPTQSQTP